MNAKERKEVFVGILTQEQIDVIQASLYCARQDMNEQANKIAGELLDWLNHEISCSHGIWEGTNWKGASE